MTPKHILPPLTFLHTPGPEHTVQGDSVTRTVLSAVYEPGTEFTSLVLSAHYTTLTNGWLLTEAQVRCGGEWSPFYKLAFYSNQLRHSFDAQEDAFAALCVDELQTKQPAQAYRFRLTLYGEMDVSGVSVCVASAHGSLLPDAAVLPPGAREVQVAALSQMCLPVPPTQQKRLCSPTSLTMAMNTLGVPSEPLEVAAGVYDTYADIYGNWTLNTAYASVRGLFACVTRFTRLAELADYITPDSLVAASIAYGPGELTGSATEKTPGHLVLLCGWKGRQIRVADPAAKNLQDVIRYYDAEEFARAWLLRKRGAAYLVRKK